MTPPRAITEREQVLEALRADAADCTACPLWRDATQTVFGEGKAGARIMLVGEQPGDREDLDGQPFVGPAGRVLDKALARAGIAREDVYVTNTVKHFKWRSKGKRRIHQKPNAEEIRACRPWLDGELDLVRPRAVVALGATAAQALLGKHARIGELRGRLVESPLADVVAVTAHPSSILRSPDDGTREQAFEALVQDLALVAKAVYPAERRRAG